MAGRARRSVSVARISYDVEKQEAGARRTRSGNIRWREAIVRSPGLPRASGGVTPHRTCGGVGAERPAGGKSQMSADIFEAVQTAVTDALGVDEDEVTPEATLLDDLGAESIDLLDILFRLERK